MYTMKLQGSVHMKKFHSFLSLLLALLMVLPAVPVFATDDEPATGDTQYTKTAITIHDDVDIKISTKIKSYDINFG